MALAKFWLWNSTKRQYHDSLSTACTALYWRSKQEKNSIKQIHNGEKQHNHNITSHKNTIKHSPTMKGKVWRSRKGERREVGGWLEQPTILQWGVRKKNECETWYLQNCIRRIVQIEFTMSLLVCLCRNARESREYWWRQNTHDVREYEKKYHVSWILHATAGGLAPPTSYDTCIHTTATTGSYLNYLSYVIRNGHHTVLLLRGIMQWTVPLLVVWCALIILQSANTCGQSTRQYTVYVPRTIYELERFYIRIVFMKPKPQESYQRYFRNGKKYK
jgi:hypothetical protein